MISKVNQKLLQVLVPMGLILQIAGLYASDDSAQAASNASSAPRPPSAFVRTAKLPSELQAAALATASVVISASTASTSSKPPVPPMPLFRPCPVRASVSADLETVVPDQASAFMSDVAGLCASGVAPVKYAAAPYVPYPGYQGDISASRPFSPSFCHPRPGSPDRWWF